MNIAGPIAKYHVARYSTDMLFSFEASMALAVLVLLSALHHAGHQLGAVWVFLVGTGVHALLEGVAEATGVRTTEHATLFGVPIRFPLTSLIIGGFEGGVVATAAYLLVMRLCAHDPWAGRLFLAFCLIFAVTGVAGTHAIHGQLDHDPGRVSFTRRAMFASQALILLGALYAVTLSYFFLNERVLPADRWSFGVYYLGIVAFTTVLALPLHVGMLRYIEIDTGGTFQVSGLWKQIVVMYAFNLPLEAGWYVGTYVVLHLLGLTPGACGHPG